MPHGVVPFGQQQAPLRSEHDSPLTASVSCPRCASPSSERVEWTFWGSYYGPPLVNHVRCLDCGYGFNGLTGRSNRRWAALFMTAPVLIIAGIVGGFALLIHLTADEDDTIRRPAVGASVTWGAPGSPPAVLKPPAFNPPARPTPIGSGGLP